MSKYSLDQFFQACGAVGPLHLAVDHGGLAVQYILPQPFALAGSDPRADLRPADGRLPHRYAYLQVLGGRLLCLDITAKSIGPKGSYPPHHWLGPGQTWQCGAMTVRFADVRPSVAAAARALQPEDLPPVSLEITGGSAGVCRYLLKVPLILIGKASQCQIRLRDTAVSRFHCALIHTPAGLWAVDLLGRGGISVNRATVRAARLDDQDELRVGGFRLSPRATHAMAAHPQRDLVPRWSDAGQLPMLPSPLTEAMALPDFSSGHSVATLSPVVALFGEFQRQMAEQFRLTMTDVVDSFRRMHEDQMQMVWHELAEVRRLTEEVTSLKAALARPRAASEAIVRPRIAASDSRSSTPTGDHKPATPPAAKPAAQGLPRSDPPRPLDRGTTPSDPDGDEVHAWLSRRVAEVQREREGRWQKIVGFLMGTPT